MIQLFASIGFITVSMVVAAVIHWCVSWFLEVNRNRHDIKRFEGDLVRLYKDVAMICKKTFPKGYKG